SFETMLDADGFVKFREVQRSETCLADRGQAGIHHDRALPPRHRHRNGPRPSVLVAVDKGVGPFVCRPVQTVPLRGDREGPIAGIGATKTATSDHARTSRTVQDKITFVGRDTPGTVALDTCEPTEVDATDASLDNRRAFRSRVFT